MKFNNIDFDTYFKNYPDANGTSVNMEAPISRPNCKQR